MKDHGGPLDARVSLTKGMPYATSAGRRGSIFVEITGRKQAGFSFTLSTQPCLPCIFLVQPTFQKSRLHLSSLRISSLSRKRWERLHSLVTSKLLWEPTNETCLCRLRRVRSNESWFYSDNRRLTGSGERGKSIRFKADDAIGGNLK